MARVYLETSFFSACVSSRTDAASVYRRDKSRLWWLTQRQHHELLICAEVLRELAAPTYPHRRAALALAGAATLLHVTDDVLGVAALLVRERVMPGPAEAGDAIHVAAAIIHRADYLLSWNVRHLANVNKVAHLKSVCARAGFLTPELITPDALWPEEEPPDEIQ